MIDESVLRSYDTCKKLTLPYFFKKQGEKTALDKTKEKYKEVVNSPRRYEEIKDPQSFFKILETRGELSAFDIHVLEDIFVDLGINTNILEHHKKLIETYKPRDEGDENQGASNTSFRDVRYNKSVHSKNQRPYDVNSNRHRLPDRDEGDEHQGASNTSFRDARYKKSVHSKNQRPFDVNSNRHRLSDRVITEISTRIGQSWRSLARFLKVQECKIHEIAQDPRLTSYEAKTRVVLQVYESQIDPADLKTNLLSALELAERTDLRHAVEKLFLRDR